MRKLLIGLVAASMLALSACASTIPFQKDLTNYETSVFASLDAYYAPCNFGPVSNEVVGSYKDQKSETVTAVHIVYSYKCPAQGTTKAVKGNGDAVIYITVDKNGKLVNIQ